MALGAMTKSTDSLGSTDHAYHDVVSFAGDSSYTTGGSTGFDALIQALLGDNRDVVAVVPLDCGGYVPVYAAGLLKVYQEAGAAGQLAEVAAAANLSAVTFNLLVISK